MKDDDFSKTEQARPENELQPTDEPITEAATGSFFFPGRRHPARSAQVKEESSESAETPQLDNSGLPAFLSESFSSAAELEVEQLPAPEQAGSSDTAEALEGEDDSAMELDEAEEEEPVVVSGDNELDYIHDDPLAPAYDLEKGNLIDKHSPMLPWRSDVRTAKEYFNSEILYRFDILEMRQRSDIAGRYRVELKGFQGGVWTIIVGDELEVINRREDADIIIVMQQKDFLQMVNGRLNPQLAILGNKMKIVGDIKKAVWFQNLLYPSAD